MQVKFSIFLYFNIVFSSPIEKPPTCQSCHTIDPNKINVHLIPHSHDDVGWLKTVDQYYYGSRSNIQKAGVQYIITSTIHALKADPKRRFMQVETAFFWKWWLNQPKSAKDDVQNLINNGQLEIVNAAWSMNDEAAVNYQSTIDQFTWGLRFINETLGNCATPKIGWQIDPFGHSREQASLYAQMGYEAVFFARIDYNDKIQRIQDKTMEVIWKGSANLENSNIFASAFPEFYYPPDGYCFDIECDDVIIDDENSPDYNVPARKDKFSKRMKELASHFRTNNILIPMGGDFHYQAAEKNYINMDRLIRAFEDDDEINLIYSTPSCYIKAVNDAASAKKVEFVQKIDDYFPYASDPHCYWTGYFTSRPNAKRYERMANNILQAVKQLASFSATKGTNYDKDIIPLRQALGVLQHHDAITGTAKQTVANDYSRLLTKAIKQAEKAISEIINNLLKKTSTTNIKLNFSICLLTNVSICEQAKTNRFIVAVYNPLGYRVNHYIRIPVQEGTYKVIGPNDKAEVCDLFDSISTFDYIKNISQTPSPKELVFPANLPPLGIQLYYIEKVNKNNPKKVKLRQTKFGTNHTNFEIDSESGLLKTVTMNGVTLEINQQFLYYLGANGNNSKDELRASGAYIFRPLINNAIPVNLEPVTIKTTIGKLVDEVHQTVNNWLTQIIRVYKGENDDYIEFDWLVGPIPVNQTSGIGREIISRFTVKNFNNKDVFYTDSNGRELIKRQLNKRYDYKYNSTFEPIASNYYPITSKIVIKDKQKKLQVAVLNDRAQGGSSLKEGMIELMVHRRLLKDDDKGVEEALNETEFGQGIVTRGQHYLIIGSEEQSAPAKQRILAVRKLLQPLVMVTEADNLAIKDIQNSFNFDFHGLLKDLPVNAHLLTLEPWKANTLLLRLEHVFEKNEDETLSQPTTVDLAKLFSLFEVKEIRETTLGANQWLDQYENKEKLVWNIENDDNTSREIISNSVGNESLEITLNPMQIKTFVVTFTQKIH